MPIISIKNLSKTYEYYKKQMGLAASLRGLFFREKLFINAVNKISFDIEEGELVGFLGPNGAGKTTALKMLSGILYPTSGEAEVMGFTPWQRKKKFQKQFGIVFGQKEQLIWDLPAMDSFLLNKEIYEINAKKFHQIVHELAEVLEIKDFLNIPVRKLSLGQRMKCELIAALLHEPKMLFLDEPTLGLDVVAQQKMRQFIKEYNQKRKTTIILTSHYMEDVEALCKRVIIINHGKIIYDGDLQALKDKYATNKILKVTFKESVKVQDLEKFGRIKEFSEKKAVIEVKRKNGTKIASQILNILPVDDILIDEMEIEEIIRKIFTQSSLISQSSHS